MSEASHHSQVPEYHVGVRIGMAIENAKGVSVQSIADDLGVSRQTVGNYIHGNTTPKRSALIVIAQRTGVPLEWLIGADYCRACGDIKSRCFCEYGHVKPVQLELSLDRSDLEARLFDFAA